MHKEPNIVIFNSCKLVMTCDALLKAEVSKTVCVFFSNARPNLTSLFHVISSNFKKVYHDSDILSLLAHYVQTISILLGATLIVNMKMFILRTYALVDHAIF
jgi:hypothetical protein